jgi:4-hydroxy-3-polyprenylbenzoate decarboxylase
VIADNLREFVKQLDAAGELTRVRRSVSVDRAIAEVADRCMKSRGGGPALLFEQPVLNDGSPSTIPVGINLFGSMRRMGIALGVDDLDVVGLRITELLQMKVPEGWREKLAMFPTIAEVAKFPPRTVRGTPACQEVVVKGPDVDLARLPVMTCWPGDGGPYITLPQVITNDPKTGVRNVGMYGKWERGERRCRWRLPSAGIPHPSIPRRRRSRRTSTSTSSPAFSVANRFTSPKR